MFVAAAVAFPLSEGKSNLLDTCSTCYINIHPEALRILVMCVDHKTESWMILISLLK